MPDSPPPETLAWLRHAASCGQRDAQLTLHILERLEALEAPQRQPHQDKLDRLIEQDRGDDDDLRTLHGIALDMVKTLPILPEIKRTLYQAIREPMEQPTPEVAPVATDKELCRAFNSTSEYGFGPALRAVYNLDRQHGAAQPPAAQPTPPAAPAGGLVERVEARAGGDGHAAIREVAAWLRELRPRKKDCYHAALSLEQETDQ